MQNCRGHYCYTIFQRKLEKTRLAISCESSIKIHMKYQVLLFSENTKQKFQTVVCCNCYWQFIGEFQFWPNYMHYVLCCVFNQQKLHACPSNSDSFITCHLFSLNIGFHMLTLILLNPDIPCLSKQCRSRSVGFCLPFSM